VANRRISELQEIAGLALAEADLLTVVQVAEVDPAIKNKKLTISGTKAYLNVYYLPRTGGTISGSVIIQNDLTVSGTTTTSGLSVTNLVTVSSLVVQTNATVSGTLSGTTVTGTNIQGTNVNGVTVTATTVTGTTINAISGNFSTQLSGALITGNTISGTSGVFVNLERSTITGNTVISNQRCFRYPGNTCSSCERQPYR
jgi:hypothetical protein